VFWFQKPRTQTKLSLNQTKKTTGMEWTNHVNIKKKSGGCGGRRRSMNWLDPSDPAKSGKKKQKQSKLQGVRENWSKFHQGK